jgi:soluble lytic murein transglycosylase-like protein
MDRTIRRLPTLMGAIFLIFALEPTPSSTAVPDPRRQPSPFEERLRQEALADWAVGRTADTTSTVVSSHDLTASLGQAPPERFGLFAREITPESRRQLLAELPYGKAMSQVSERHGVDGLLVAAIVETESQFEPEAVSPRGAVGLMQVRPAIGRAFGKGGLEALEDPATNLEVGSRYLRSLLEDYNGDLRLTLAAYNAGPGAVARFGGVPPFAETRSYVRRVLTLYQGHHRKAEAASEARQQTRGFSLWGKAPAFAENALPPVNSALRTAEAR